MKINYEITDIGADALRCRLIEQTAKQHRFLVKKRAKSKERDRFLNDQIKDLERFFRSGWGQLLSGGHGEYIIEKDYEVVKEELARERRRLK